ncbi:MAG: siderophore-interacting protein [Actinomycetota bacterium]
MTILQTIRQSTVKNLGEVVETADDGDGLRRIRFRARHTAMAWRPGQALAIIVDAGGRRMKDRWRHYTIRRRDQATGELELLVTVHRDAGPGARWASTIDPGDEFVFMGPGGGPTLTLPDAPCLILGDRTSAAAAGAMLDALAPTTPATAFLATPHPERARLDTSRPDDVRWLAASSATEIREALVEAAAVAPIETDAVHAYVTGEQAAVRAVRRTLRDRGVAPRRIRVHAHWSPDRIGM